MYVYIRGSNQSSCNAVLMVCMCVYSASKVISQAHGRFTPSITAIKRCIELLIEKQYLQRHEESRDTYSYIA